MKNNNFRKSGATFHHLINVAKVNVCYTLKRAYFFFFLKFLYKKNFSQIQIKIKIISTQFVIIIHKS